MPERLRLFALVLVAVATVAAVLGLFIAATAWGPGAQTTSWGTIAVFSIVALIACAMFAAMLTG